MELQNLFDEPVIPEPASKGLTGTPLGDQSQDPAQRPNVPPISGLGNIPTGTILTDEQRICRVSDRLRPTSGPS